MKSKRFTVISLLLLSALTIAGCGLFHHCGPRHGKPGCEIAGGKPCAQQGDCAKAMENKPCCEKMKAAETPASPAK